MKTLSEVPFFRNGKKINFNSLCQGDLLRVHLVNGLGEGKNTYIQGLYVRRSQLGILGVQTTLSYRPIMTEWINHVEVLFSNIN